MDSKNMKYRLALSLFILICVIIYFRFKNSDSQGQKNEPIKNLPSISVNDINNKRIDYQDLIGKNVYVQFVNSSDKDDIELLETVSSIWSNEDVEIVIITNKFSENLNKLEMQHNKIIFIEDNESQLEKTFNAPSGNNTYYLFDKNGKLYTRGYNVFGYKKSLKVELLKLIKKRFFNVSDFVRINENLTKIPWLQQINEFIKQSGKKNNIVILLSSICESCGSGKIARKLNKLYSENSTDSLVFGILSDKYNSDDIKAFKSQLDVNFPIMIANDDLSKKWNYLIDDFNEDSLNNIIMIISKNGMVKKVFNKSCNCYDEFFALKF